MAYDSGAPKRGNDMDAKRFLTYEPPADQQIAEKILHIIREHPHRSPEEIQRDIPEKDKPKASKAVISFMLECYRLHLDFVS